MMNLFPQSLLLLINLLSTLHHTTPFLLPHTTPTFTKPPPTKTPHNNINHPSLPTTPSPPLYGKLWETLQTDESPTLQWYLLNCIVGTERQLLDQCIHSCAHFSPTDVDRFVVPTERLARSHGKRNVVDDLVLYPGYVFARIRLCEEVYETIQQLAGCRSWMGTIRKVNNMGHRKLPSLPEPLTEAEVAQFRGLEEKLEAANNRTTVVAAEELMTEYDGFEVGGYVKITSGKFGGEEGIVKRLKKGKISVRMYTYGSQYDEWFRPAEIRPMTELEVMRGLQGPERPINQEQFDVSIGKRTARDRVTRDDGEGTSRRGLRNELMGSVKGVRGREQRRFRNRREDRASRGENRGLWGSEEEVKRERDNWEAYKKKQIDEAWKSQDGNANAASSSPSRRGASEWGDFIGRSDSTPARPRRDKKPPMGTGGERTKREEMALDGDGDDWGDYFSEDDFFDGLVDDLKGRQQQETTKSKAQPSPVTRSADDSSSSRGGGTKTRKSNDDDDDFFSSLMNELADSMEDDDGRGSNSRESDTIGGKGDLEDDFFMELEKEMTSLGSGISDDGATKKSTSAVDEEDDFFASLEREMTNAGGAAAFNDDDDNDDKRRQQPHRRSGKQQPTNDDDFFASLEEELSTDVNSFYDVEKTAPTSTDNEDVAIPTASSASSSSRPSPTTTKSNDSSTNYSKLTVAALKEKLRERGMKVSGKKADLIERLQSSS